MSHLANYRSFQRRPSHSIQSSKPNQTATKLQHKILNNTYSLLKNVNKAEPSETKATYVVPMYWYSRDLVLKSTEGSWSAAGLDTIQDRPGQNATTLEKIFTITFHK